MLLERQWERESEARASASDFLSDAQRSQIEILFPCHRAASNQRGAQCRVYGLGAFHGCFVPRIRATIGRLHSYRDSVLFRSAHCRRGGAQRFLPIVMLGHELGFLIANRDLNAVGANANGGKRAGGNTIARHVSLHGDDGGQRCLLENLLSQVVLAPF